MGWVLFSCPLSRSTVASEGSAGTENGARLRSISRHRDTPLTEEERQHQAQGT